MSVLNFNEKGEYFRVSDGKFPVYMLRRTGKIKDEKGKSCDYFNVCTNTAEEIYMCIKWNSPFAFVDGDIAIFLVRKGYARFINEEEYEAINSN